MIVTRDTADEVWDNPYTLAAYWADRTHRPLPGQQSGADALHELAVVSTLADWLRLWLPLHIHDALVRGADVAAVAAAAGITPDEVRQLWEPWAQRQVDLWHTSNPDRRTGLDPAVRDQVHTLFRKAGDQS